MFRGVRNRIGRRRMRRLDIQATTSTTTAVGEVPSTRLNQPSTRPSQLSTRPSQPSTRPSQPSSPRQNSLPSTLPTHRLDSISPLTSEPVPPSDDSPTKQPFVFRNRSLDSTHRSLAGGARLRRILPGKALRPFHRTRGSVTSTTGNVKDNVAGDESPAASRDRPLFPTVPPDKLAPAPGDAAGLRNDDSFSSLPSTHASRDPFLNDDVPVDIARVEGREDRPRKEATRRGEQDTEQPFLRNTATSTVGLLPFEGARSTGDSHSPPASFSSSSTFRKRSSLWKRTYDPENEFQSSHERQILKAVSLSEAAVKERSVSSAQQLVRIVNLQVLDLDVAVTEVDKAVAHARSVARELPSSRDAQYEALLYAEGHSTAPSDGLAGKAEAERVFRELQWTERVWDVEAMVAEKRYEDCVASIEKLEEDGIVMSASPRTQAKYQSIKQQLVREMSSCCTQYGGETASLFAPLLARVGMGEHARNVVLDSAESELMSELHAMSRHGADVAPQTVNAMLDKSLSIFKTTYAGYAKILPSSSQSSSFFVAWIVEQCDNVYKKFVSPILAKMQRVDPVTILATIEAARHRKFEVRQTAMQNEDSLMALLETRITAHIREDLDPPIREVERKLIDRARMYALAVPRNWREAPFQSGKAICDELNILSKSLEGALMNLGTETDILIGNLLVRLGLEYSITLLEVGTQAASDGTTVSESVMQEGVYETFSMIGRTLMRTHQKYPRIPLLERAAIVLTLSNVEALRILLGELSSNRADSATLPKLTKFSDKMVHRVGEDAVRAQGKQIEAGAV